MKKNKLKPIEKILGKTYKRLKIPCNLVKGIEYMAIFNIKDTIVSQPFIAKENRTIEKISLIDGKEGVIYEPTTST